ncbi:hypothetical protein BO83DRAFT_413690 [Aspergillus eucalypticola CBS 122712]|uniref:Uncharacterized protein n=1 Tax=Aspergillus eucalypticola (strain CBS 122712 / IBT 29274) TaxID=1448314 RepID=A0A317WEN0_ASPEC|nr:uncharacterized protein BO83DRAFT_413690 [Aspergillus eucalypticola CBS 122712]PWY84201.1 hypothetical protein BO83DRAFT_413690 [Aspergillus eucalypticola CBS 122712]
MKPKKEEGKDPTTPASTFLQTELYHTASQPGLRSLPPSPSRDFLTLTWGPIIYLTTYTPSSSNNLLSPFLQSLNTEIHHAIRRVLPGNPSQTRLLESSYAAKVFSGEKLYGDKSVEEIRRVFHDWKRVDLALPAVELPVRLRVCLVVDKGVLERFGRLVNGDGDEDGRGGECCPVIMVEENFPDIRRRDSNPADEGFPGWTWVALRAVVEVFDGLRGAGGLRKYHREGEVYLGDGRWGKLG